MCYPDQATEYRSIKRAETLIGYRTPGQERSRTARPRSESALMQKYLAKWYGAIYGLVLGFADLHFLEHPFKFLGAIVVLIATTEACKRGAK